MEPKVHYRAHNRTTTRRSSLTSHSRTHNQPDAPPPLLSKYVSHWKTAIQNTAFCQKNGNRSPKTLTVFQCFVLSKPLGLREPCGSVSWTPCLCHCSRTFLCVSLSTISILSFHPRIFLTPSGLSTTILCAFPSSPRYSQTSASRHQDTPHRDSNP